MDEPKITADDEPEPEPVIDSASEPVAGSELAAASGTGAVAAAEPAVGAEPEAVAVAEPAVEAGPEGAAEPEPPVLAEAEVVATAEPESAVAPEPEAGDEPEGTIEAAMPQAAAGDPEQLDDAGPGAEDWAFAHAPTSNLSRRLDAPDGDDEQMADDFDFDFDAEEDFDEEDEEDYELAAAEGIDRRRDPVWWLVTPVLVLLLGPLITVSIGFFVAGTDDGYPAICRAAAADNRCEEVVLQMFAQHIVAFLIGWLLIWALPWWRGLRRYRVALAVVVVLVLVAAPLRLISTLDYPALSVG